MNQFGKWPSMPKLEKIEIDIHPINLLPEDQKYLEEALEEERLLERKYNEEGWFKA